jgi:hypothetical protein
MTGGIRAQFRACAVAGGAILLSSVPVFAQSPIPAQFRGDWVPQTAACASAVRFRVEEKTVTLINGADSQTWGDVALPTQYFGPDYRGISVVALPDFEGSQPFIVYFNVDEKKGVTKVEIYIDMRGKLNPVQAKLQADAKKLAARFPLNNLPLKKCAGAPPAGK